MSTLHAYIPVASLGSCNFQAQPLSKEKRSESGVSSIPYSAYAVAWNTAQEKQWPQRTSYACLHIVVWVESLVGCPELLVQVDHLWFLKSPTLYHPVSVVSARPRKVINTTASSRWRGCIVCWSRLLRFSLLILWEYLSVRKFLAAYWNDTKSEFPRCQPFMLIYRLPRLAAVTSKHNLYQKKKGARAEWVRFHTRHMQ